MYVDTLAGECVHECARLQLSLGGTENVKLGTAAFMINTSAGEGVRYGTLKHKSSSTEG